MLRAWANIKSPCPLPRNKIKTKRSKIMDIQHKTGDPFADIFGIGGLSMKDKSMNAYNSAEALKNRDFQDQQAQRQMGFQKEMSDTSYQRAVADLKKAGLNPALAYMQGGASSASGASGSGSQAHGSTDGDKNAMHLLSSAIALVGGTASKAIGSLASANKPVSNIYMVK